MVNKRKYEVVKEDERFTIAMYDESYKAYIINDGIYGYYWWKTKEEAQAAANAYNEYEGCEWLGTHWLGEHDVIYYDELSKCDEKMIELYRLFHAIKPCEIEDETDDDGLIPYEEGYIASHNANIEKQEELILEGKEVFTWSVQNSLADNDIYCGTYAECLNEAIRMAFNEESVSGIALIELKEGLLLEQCKKFVAIEDLIPGWEE